jgi:hypothetical protein
LAGFGWQNLIQGKVGGIQVLVGLAPSSQTVGSNITAPEKLSATL